MYPASDMNDALSGYCKGAAEPALSADGWQTRTSTDDLDQVQEVDRAAQWDTHFYRYEQGALRASIRLAESRSFQVVENTFESGVMIRGAIPEGAVVFGLLSAREHGYQGLPVDASTVVIASSTDEIEYWCKGRTRLITAAFGESEVARAVEARWGVPLEVFLKAKRQSLGGGRHVAGLQCELASFFDHPTVGPSGSDPDAARHDALLDLLLRHLQPPTQPVEPLPFRRHLAAAAADYLRAHADQPVSIASLCRELGARERTIFLGFKERYGLTPHAYITMLRMDSARKALLCAPPGTRVTDIALQSGAMHLGRFSTEYRRRFGESPSKTLSRNAWQAAA